MSKYLTPELEENELGLKLKNKPIFEDQTNETEKNQNNEAKIEIEKLEIETDSPTTNNLEINPNETIDYIKIPLVDNLEKTINQTADNNQNRFTPQESKKIPSKLQGIIDFVLLSGIIFAIIFLFVNFSAYKQILTTYLFPENQSEKTENLQKAVGNNAIKQILISVDNSKKHIKKTFPPLNLQITPPDNRIIIPKIGQNIPLVEMGADNLQGENWAELETQIQEGLRNGVVHYPGTATPGQIGNVFITGHSSYYPWDKGQYKDVFALLPQLNVGDEYQVFYDQKKYSYRIKEKKEVYPSNVQVLQQPESEKISTLMTCVPVGTALRRLIIVAEEI